MKRLALLLAAMLALAHMASAQDFITLSGKVYDKQSRQPVPYAATTGPSPSG